MVASRRERRARSSISSEEDRKGRRIEENANALNKGVQERERERCEEGVK